MDNQPTSEPQPGMLATGESLEEGARPNRFKQILGQADPERECRGFETPTDAAEASADRNEQIIKAVAKAEGLSAKKVRDQFIRDFLVAYEDESHKVVPGLRSTEKAKAKA